MNRLFILSVASLLLAAPALAKERRGLTSPGKPRAPILVESDVNGTVRGGEEHDVTLTFKTASGCDAVESRVFAAAGAELAAPAAKALGPLVPAKGLRQTVKARVPAGVSGELVVVVTCRVGDQTRDVVQVIPFAAKGLRGEAPVRAEKPMGTVEVDERGQRVHVLRSAP